MSNGFLGAIRTYIENKVEGLIDLVHPEVSAAVAAISHSTVDLIEELEARVTALEATIKSDIAKTQPNEGNWLRLPPVVPAPTLEATIKSDIAKTQPILPVVPAPTK